MANFSPFLPIAAGARLHFYDLYIILTIGNDSSIFDCDSGKKIRFLKSKPTAFLAPGSPFQPEPEKTGLTARKKPVERGKIDKKGFWNNSDFPDLRLNFPVEPEYRLAIPYFRTEKLVCI